MAAGRETSWFLDGRALRTTPLRGRRPSAMVGVSAIRDLVVRVGPFTGPRWDPDILVTSVAGGQSPRTRRWGQLSEQSGAASAAEYFNGRD
jgi:hypothetical protein